MNSLPAWNNTTEYPSIESPEFLADYQTAKELIRKIEVINQELAPRMEAVLQKRNTSTEEVTSIIKQLQESAQLSHEAQVLCSNLIVYVSCESNLDTTNAIAQKWKSVTQNLGSTLSVARMASDVFLKSCDDSIIQKYLDSEITRSEAFQLSRKRIFKDFSLSQEEEKIIASFSNYGLHAWGNLYSQMSGGLKVKMPTLGEMGMAQASEYIRAPDEKVRKEAWEAIQASWKTIEVPMAAVLNNISGFRLEEYRKRSCQKTLHFLDTPIMGSNIERKTLDALIQAVDARIEMPRNALRAMAKKLGKEKLEPWNLTAPFPETEQSKKIPFEEAFEKVTRAFASVDSKMGDFVHLMLKNGWIEARVLPNKGTGAHCTKFAKSRTPRVFQTYTGSLRAVSTLAHELGHAYHNWVMRDLPLEEVRYPMTLAETASIFSETALNETMLKEGTDAEKKNILWEEVGHAAMFLLNIFARFDFEKSFYEAREKGPLSPQELNDLTDQAWKKWYGDTITQPESQYWMTKLHFSLSGTSFYNFPYTFGYLFALGIYAQKEKMGAKFPQFYEALLRDTGRMTAEELVQKHLGLDIRERQFWDQALNIVESKINLFLHHP